MLRVRREGGRVICKQRRASQRNVTDVTQHQKIEELEEI